MEKKRFQSLGPVHKIVIHHTTETYRKPVAANVKVLELKGKLKGYGGVPYHFVIGNGVAGWHRIGRKRIWAKSIDGGIEIGRPLWAKGAHAIPNRGAIGIALVGNFNYSTPTKRQMNALKVLVLYLLVRFKLKVDDIVAHREYQSTQKLCPGKYFDMYAFRKIIGKKLDLLSRDKARKTERGVERKTLQTDLRKQMLKQLENTLKKYIAKVEDKQVEDM